MRKKPEVLHRDWVRFAGAVVVAVLAGGLAWAFGLSSTTVAVICWGGFALTLMLWIWVTVHRLDGAGTREHALREDPARGLRDVLLAGALVASLVAVGLLLTATQGTATAKIIAAVFGLGAVLLSWALVHTVYMLRYAAMYYSSDRSPAVIDFNSPDEPRYIDFAYFSFNLGMTFQVSDTTVTSSDVRRVALLHCLGSFFLTSVVIGNTFNLITQLMSAGN